MDQPASHMWHVGRRVFLRTLPWLAGGAVALIPEKTAPLQYPLEVAQSVLARLGYLRPGWESGALDGETSRALVRFKRHAKRVYRMTSRGKRPDDVAREACFPGACDLTFDETTLLEMRQWLGREWVLPLGRFKLESLAPNNPFAPKELRWTLLREDVAAQWRVLLKEIDGRGGTLAGPYGDTWRPLGYHRKQGASARSFHIVGRAIDLNQNLGSGRNQRYFLVAEPDGGRVYWRIWCKTARQDGSQGKLFRAGAIECYNIVDNHPYPIPEGHYMDLTAFLEEGKFERIPARRGWEKNSGLAEWWHYNYSVDKQETFLDECELVGISEQDLLRAGYSHDDIDQRPG